MLPQIVELLQEDFLEVEAAVVDTLLTVGRFDIFDDLLGLWRE